MSIVVSSEESQSARRVSGGVFLSRSARQIASPPTAVIRARGTGMLRPGASTPLGRKQLGDELAEDDRLSVGDEVGRTGLAPLRRQNQPLDRVIDVGGRGQVTAAADPGETPGLDRRDQ